MIQVEEEEGAVKHSSFFLCVLSYANVAFAIIQLFIPAFIII